MNMKYVLKKTLAWALILVPVGLISSLLPFPMVALIGGIIILAIVIATGLILLNV